MCGVVIWGNIIVFGQFVLQVQECGWIILCQIEVSCCVMICYVKCGGKIWIWIFFDKLVIMCVVEIWMGFGKGNLEFWVVVIKFGWILFEMGGDEIIFEIVKEVMCFV